MVEFLKVLLSSAKRLKSALYCRIMSSLNFVDIGDGPFQKSYNMIYVVRSPKNRRYFSQLHLARSQLIDEGPDGVIEYLCQNKHVWYIETHDKIKLVVPLHVIVRKADFRVWLCVLLPTLSKYIWFTKYMELYTINSCFRVI